MAGGASRSGDERRVRSRGYLPALTVFEASAHGDGRVAVEIPVSRDEGLSVLIPRTLLGTAQVPQGSELRLFSRGDDFIIALDRNELMSSRMSGSEEALAVMSCERLPRGDAPHLLIGGYGMGFTLRAALAELGPKARVSVASVIWWIASMQ